MFDRKTAAKRLHISVVSLDRLRRQGKLSFRKILGRILFAECDLIEFFNSCAIPAKADGGKK
ncbi:MAG: helix-turn-helix domain-containing protein [Treponema sp.]|nr:helix-turn-helix domain-containing protein [Treponema sp.]